MSYLTMNLSPEQCDIVLSNNKAMCIIACAGAGKTKTIIAKIIYMINDLNCLPEEFFITTFTVNATNEIKHRLLEYLSEEIVSKMKIGTFHSIAHSFCTNDDENNIIENNLESYLYSFNDMLENDLGFRYIFIDEYQDINDIQESIIRKLYNNCLTLVVTGDDQQNIYTFRETNIKYILNFTKNYKDSVYKYLIKNYRCNTNIVTLANIVLKYNIHKIDKNIIAMNPHKPVTIKLVRYVNRLCQINNVIEMLEREYNKNRGNCHKIAIIARSNDTLKQLEYKMAEKNIPSFYIESSSDASQQKRINIKDITERFIITTIHGTKGLEFENVIMLDVDNDIFPSLNVDIEEERRLFYVGITRAIKKLSICYTENKPSQFITEILENSESKKIIDMKSEYENLSVTIKPRPETKERKKDYSVSNIIASLKYEDYQELKDFIVNVNDLDLINIKLHPRVPDIITEFCERDLIITNCTTFFDDFIQTFITRTIQHITNTKIENIDYVMYALYYYKHGIKDIKNRQVNEIIDKKFKTDLKNKSDEELDKLSQYYLSGTKIKGKLDESFMEYFIKSYERYTSNKPSKDIIFDIFVISTIKNIIRGRNSVLQLVNFDRNSYYDKKINKNDIGEYDKWLIKIENSLIKHFQNFKQVLVHHLVIDDKTNIKGIIDLICDDTVIKIATNKNEKINIETFLTVLSHLSLARTKDDKLKYNNIDKCAIYNVITGQMITCDLSTWTNDDDLIYFLNNKFY